jgi:chromate transport protein ChrA
MSRDDANASFGRPERPRSEPEIIPPGRQERRQGRQDGPIWMSGEQFGGTHRIYIARPGPFSIIIALVIAGLVLAAIVLLLAGLVLVWVPVIVFVVAALLLAGYSRYYWARFKLWLARR